MGSKKGRPVATLHIFFLFGHAHRRGARKDMRFLIWLETGAEL
jgi:hypothetical protein